MRITKEVKKNRRSYRDDTATVKLENGEFRVFATDDSVNIAFRFGSLDFNIWLDDNKAIQLTRAIQYFTENPEGVK